MVIVESVNIEVELYGIPVVGHKSFGDAIKAGLSAPVALRAKADSGPDCGSARRGGLLGLERSRVPAFRWQLATHIFQRRLL